MRGPSGDTLGLGPATGTGGGETEPPESHGIPTPVCIPGVRAGNPSGAAAPEERGAEPPPAARASPPSAAEPGP